MSMELPDETRLYKIKSSFANKEKIPIYFAARPIRQTEKAVLLTGHGTTEIAQKGVCMQCGHELTHPVSVELGIGPFCGGHHHDWNTIGGYSAENMARLKQAVREITIEKWIPKSCIEGLEETKEKIDVPKEKPTEMPKKQAKLVYYKKSASRAIKIVFPQDSEFKDNLEKVKTLSGRRFHNEPPTPYWTCPLKLESVESLLEWGFELDEGLKDFLNRSKVHSEAMPGTLEVPTFKGELRPFQRRGVEFIEHRNGSALIGDEMGLGKTIQALAYLELHPEIRPAVVIGPASSKLNWKWEAEKFMSNPEVQVLYSSKADEPLTGNIIIINYDILPNKYETRTDRRGKKYQVEHPYTGWVDYLIDFKPEAIIVDECHYIKNPQANRAKATLKLGRRCPRAIAMSGTPIINRPYEGYNALKLVDETSVPGFWTYVKRYCGAHHNGFGWDYTGASNTQELHQKLVNTVMIRRKKTDVLRELPEKVRSIVPMEIDNWKEYNNVAKNFIEWVRQNRGEKAAQKASQAEALTQINALKQLVVKGKMKRIKEWIRNYIDTAGKLVVFTTHKETLKTLMEEFGHLAVKVDGDNNSEQRNEAVRKFQNDDDTMILVGQIQAAGTVLTLTAASSVAFVELGWSPGEHDQAEDRVHRIGQTAESITAYYLTAADTIEQTILDLLDTKRKTVSLTLDGEEDTGESLTKMLLDAYQDAA